MLIPYFLIYFCLNLMAQTPAPVIKPLPNPQSPTNFEHQNPGCPENSECDQIMGKQLSNWKDLIEKISDEKFDPSKRAQYLELFRQKYGIPAEFYTNIKSQQGFKPLYFKSPCKIHNPKDEKEAVVKGEAFVKGINGSRALVIRANSQMEIPSELLIAQPVTVYWDTPVTFYLPLMDQPLFIRNKELYVLKEEEGLFFMLKIAINGDWKVENIDLAELSKWEDKRSNVECPKEQKPPSKYFENEYCKTVLDEDLKKLIIVKMRQGCSI